MSCCWHYNLLSNRLLNCQYLASSLSDTHLWTQEHTLQKQCQRHDASSPHCLCMLHVQSRCAYNISLCVHIDNDVSCKANTQIAPQASKRLQKIWCFGGILQAIPKWLVNMTKLHCKGSYKSIEHSLADKSILTPLCAVSLLRVALLTLHHYSL